MFVSDLRDFLDLPDEAPGPARRMGEHLSSIVRAATSREPADPWETALPCRRRPGNRRCPGHIAVYRHEGEGRIEWSCTVCDDQGVISGWDGSPYDLRRTGTEQDLGFQAVVLSTGDWATVRSLSFLDSDCERLVYSATPAGSNVVFETNVDGLENLLEHVAAEANHEEDRRKQKRLDVAVDVLERQLYEIEAGAAELCLDLGASGGSSRWICGIRTPLTWSGRHLSNSRKAATGNWVSSPSKAVSTGAPPRSRGNRPSSSAGRASTKATRSEDVVGRPWSRTRSTLVN
jgi:hypothetical protein